MIIGIIPSDIKFYTVKTLKLNLFFKKYTFYIFTVHFKDGKKFTFLMKNKARVDNLINQIIYPGIDKKNILNKFDTNI